MEDWLWQLVEDKSIAEGLFGNTMRAAGQSATTENRHDESVLALAIDPLFAPALLTVGSQEYRYGRVNAVLSTLSADCRTEFPRKCIGQSR